MSISPAPAGTGLVVGAADLGAMASVNKLNSFFPFDPFLLRRSSRCLAPLYLAYEDYQAACYSDDERGDGDELMGGGDGGGRRRVSVDGSSVGSGVRSSLGRSRSGSLQSLSTVGRSRASSRASSAAPPGLAGSVDGRPAHTGPGNLRARSTSAQSDNSRPRQRARLLSRDTGSSDSDSSDSDSSDSDSDAGEGSKQRMSAVADAKK